MRVVPPGNKSRQVMGKNAYAHIFGTSAIRQGNDGGGGEWCDNAGSIVDASPLLNIGKKGKCSQGINIPDNRKLGHIYIFCIILY